MLRVNRPGLPSDDADFRPCVMPSHEPHPQHFNGCTVLIAEWRQQTRSATPIPCK